MIHFKLFSIQFMTDEDTINWKDKTITLRHNIKFIHTTINYYPEQTYKIKKSNDIVYNWNKFLKYWNKHLPEYTKAFNIEFDKLILDVDYSIAPISISSSDNIYIGIYIYNTTIIKNMNSNQEKQELQTIKMSKKTYSFLSSMDPYVVSKKKNSTNNSTNNNIYNFIYGILNKDSEDSEYSKTDYLKNKEFILDTNINIQVKHILQNSMNYLPKLEINRIKMNSQNLLNP